MFNSFKDDIDPDPHQGGLSSAPKKTDNTPVPCLLAQAYMAASEQPYLKRLGVEDAALFLQKHTETRVRLAEQGLEFMKELKPELLDQLMEKKMHVVGMFVGTDMVSGCAILYPADRDIAAYLSDYDFEGKEDTTAVISAVWTDLAHTGKGYSKKVVAAGMELALIEGKEVFRAKVDKQNEASLGLFNGFKFDTSVQGSNPAKLYPVLAL